MELTPKTRKETFLAAAGGQDVTTPTPITREEVFLDAIAKNGGSGGGSSGGGVLVVHDVNGTLDKTWKEIDDARKVGVVSLIGNKDISGYDIVMYLSTISGSDDFWFADFTTPGGSTKSYASDSQTETMTLDE